MSFNSLKRLSGLSPGQSEAHGPSRTLPMAVIEPANRDDALPSVTTMGPLRHLGKALVDLKGEHVYACDVGTGTGKQGKAACSSGLDGPPVAIVAEDEDAGEEADQHVTEREGVGD